MKKHILFIVPLPLPVHGSAMVSQYIKESRLINDAFDCDFVNLSTSRKMDEIGKTTVAKLFRFLSSYLKVFAKLLFTHYDLCYLAITCHGVGFLKDAPFVLICKLFGVKIVIHQHNKGMNAYVDKPLYKRLLPLVYRNTRVILLSWKLYADIERVVGREQILICPNGIPEVFGEEPYFERNHSIPKLLFLSNLIESKGVFVLLDACEILKNQGVTFCCDFVGGETKEIDAGRFVREVEMRGLVEFVFYHGQKYGGEKDAFFRDADIFVFPTYYDNEAFPLVLLEAMQYKLPILSTDEGGITDIVSNGINGFIVERQNAKDLAEKLLLLLSQPSLRISLGEEGYRISKSQFTYKIFENNISKALDMLY